MTYFKNVELASKYNISESTVRNWVKTAKEGKLKLALSEHKGRSYVANLPSNIPIIERLVEENKKYRNSRSARTVTPRPEFYTLFNQEQIYDIVRSLEIHHEIPRQYNYFDGGAAEWNKYTDQLEHEETPNILNRTISLIADNQNYLDQRLSKYSKVNVIDIGVGNARPAKAFLNHLLDKEMLSRYIAIDISPSMLEIAETNIRKWFGNKIIVEKHALDITRQRFDGIIRGDYLNEKSSDSANVILCFGGTLSNFKNPDDSFRIINESMNPGDLLVIVDKLEKEQTRPQWFDRNIAPGKLKLPSIHRLVFDLLNIDNSFYDVEMGATLDKHLRYSRARLKVALTLKFNFGEGGRIIELEKGDTILLWRRFWQTNYLDSLKQFERTGFYTLHSSQTEDHEYILTISEVKRG